MTIYFFFFFFFSFVSADIFRLKRTASSASLDSQESYNAKKQKKGMLKRAWDNFKKVKSASDYSGMVHVVEHKFDLSKVTKEDKKRSDHHKYGAQQAQAARHHPDVAKLKVKILKLIIIYYDMCDENVDKSLLKKRCVALVEKIIALEPRESQGEDPSKVVDFEFKYKSITQHLHTLYELHPDCASGIFIQ